MHEFQLKMCEMHKTADFHSNLLVSLELVTEGYQGTPVWNAYMVILWLFILVFILFSAIEKTIEHLKESLNKSEEWGMLPMLHHVITPRDLPRDR